MLEQSLSALGEAHTSRSAGAACNALDQRQIELTLELPYSLGYRWLADEQRARSPREAPVLGHRRKDS